MIDLSDARTNSTSPIDSQQDFKELERRINHFLDQKGIELVHPSDKQIVYFEKAKVMVFSFAEFKNVKRNDFEGGFKSMKNLDYLDENSPERRPSQLNLDANKLLNKRKTTDKMKIQF